MDRGKIDGFIIAVQKSHSAAWTNWKGVSNRYEVVQISTIMPTRSTFCFEKGQLHMHFYNAVPPWYLKVSLTLKHQFLSSPFHLLNTLEREHIVLPFNFFYHQHIHYTLKKWSFSWYKSDSNRTLGYTSHFRNTVLHV